MYAPTCTYVEEHIIDSAPDQAHHFNFRCSSSLTEFGKKYIGITTLPLCLWWAAAESPHEHSGTQQQEEPPRGRNYLAWQDQIETTSAGKAGRPKLKRLVLQSRPAPHTPPRRPRPPIPTVDGDSTRPPTHGILSLLLHASCCPEPPSPPASTAPGTTSGLVAMDSDARPRLPSLTPTPLSLPESLTVANGVRPAPLLARLGGVAMDREARARRLGALGVTCAVSSSIYPWIWEGAAKAGSFFGAAGEIRALFFFKCRVRVRVTTGF